MKKKIVIAGGKVHGIGYRAFLLAVAESFKIKRFFADNFFLKGMQSVYILLDSDKEKINAFIQHISKNYPEKAEVENISQEDYSGNVIEIEAYYRYFNASQLSKIANYGGEMLGKQDSMLEKQDSMLEKQDSMLGKQDSMLEKQDKTIEILKSIKEDTSAMLEKQDETIGVIREEGEKTREVFKEHLAKDIAKLYEEIAEIKATLSKVVEKVGA